MTQLPNDAMTQSLEWLNKLAAVQAEDEFLKCCGSTRWAKQMTEARPFATFGQLSSKADDIWSRLGEDDWGEAFRAHPKIGERKAGATQSHQAANWSAQEQAQAERADNEVKAAIAAGNRIYEERFGFIFIICATGKSAEEIAIALRDRLANDAKTELRIAAEEQRRITQLRLKKLLTT